MAESYRVAAIPTKEREFILSRHSQFMLHARVFNEEQSLITMGSDGDVHLYLKTNQKWTYKSHYQASDVPIIAYDIVPFLGDWRLIVVNMKNQITILTITENVFILEQTLEGIISNSPVISCACSEKTNDIYLSDAQGGLYIYSKCQKWLLNAFEIRSTPLRVVLGADEQLLIAIGKQVEKIVYSKNENKIISQYKEPLLKTKSNIVEFVVSKDKHAKYSTVVVLTEAGLQFYLANSGQNWSSLVSEFAIDFNGQIYRIGWGRDCSELCLYCFIEGRIQTKIFKRKLDGIWKIM